MACTAITDYLTRESGRFLEGGIFRRVFGSSLWMGLTRRGVYPAGLSETINVLTIERSAPYETTPAWTAMTVSDGAAGGLCLPTTTALVTGSTTRSFGLYRKALEGPDFCADEFRTVFQLTERLNRITDSFAENVRLQWEMQDRNEYFKWCKTKVIVNGCPPATDTTTAASWSTVASNTSATIPTSKMTQGILDKFYLKLVRDGATPVARLGTGAPILAYVAEAEVLDSLIRDNSDIRQDYRWSKPFELLAGLGVERVYRNYIHMQDLYPNRYTASGATYTKVATFAQSAATKGYKAEINPSWETATYTESFIHSPSVLEQLVPQPIVSPGTNFNFNPVNYTGTMKVMNIPNRDCNPDGNILYHRMIMAAGTKPEYPEHGVAFISLRCDPPCNLITACAT